MQSPDQGQPQRSHASNPVCGRGRLWLFAAALMLLMARSLSAQEVDFGTAGNYAAFILGDVTQLSEVEGRLAVGRDLQLSHLQVGARLPRESSATPSLVVGGNIVRLDKLAIWGNGGQRAHGVYAGSSASRSAALRQEQDVIDFASEALWLALTAQQLGERPASGTVALAGATLTLTGQGKPIETFFLSAAQLARGKKLQLKNILPGAHLILNVASDHQRRVSLGLNLDVLASRAHRTLFNFPDADLIKIDGIRLWGSLLAPQACIQGQSGRIEGSVMALSWQAAVEIGHTPFDALR